MNGRESSELGLPGDIVDTKMPISAPTVKKNAWLFTAAIVQPMTQTLIAVKAIGPKLPTRSPSTTRL